MNRPVLRPLEHERQRLVRDSRLHRIHWVILAISLGITFGAWSLSSTSIREKAQFRFDRDTAQLIELVQERMRKYEDALQAGTAFVRLNDSELTDERWRAYAESLQVDRKYPGINGIGTIDAVTHADRDAYLSRHRTRRPDFEIHPAHNNVELLPITFVEPVGLNRPAIGLDMAHEANRYQAAVAARRSGESRITGSIVLVQDEQKTPGFLFFAPWYHPGATDTQEQRIERFAGFVYAPFIVRKLMGGALAESTRHVLLRISDGEDVLYDEISGTAVEHATQFRTTRPVPMYGRQWTFDMVADDSFREHAGSSEPATILVAGVVIDGLLFALFLSMARSNRRAVAFAMRANASLERHRARLEQANDELAQFNYRTSHDLVAPLRTIVGFANLADEDLGANALDEVRYAVRRIKAQAERLIRLVNSLLDLQHADHQREAVVPIDLVALVEHIADHLPTLFADLGVEVRLGALTRRTVRSDPTRVRQILENLLANGAKYADPAKEVSFVEVSTSEDARGISIHVRDNGLGIPKGRETEVFDMFVRLHPDVGEGSGLGLYLVNKHADRLGAQLRVESEEGVGSTFTLLLPNT